MGGMLTKKDDHERALIAITPLNYGLQRYPFCPQRSWDELLAQLKVGVHQLVTRG
jgi:hypothetical protein